MYVFNSCPSLEHSMLLVSVTRFFSHSIYLMDGFSCHSRFTPYIARIVSQTNSPNRLHTIRHMPNEHSVD